MNTKIINISEGFSSAVDIAINALELGEIIAIPTETVYGLAVDFNNANAINNLFAIKNRSINKPLTAFCYSEEQVKELCAETPDAFNLLAKEFVPGPISFVLNKKADIISTNQTTIAIRIPDNDFVLSLLKKSKKLLATTSANLSDKSSAINIKDVFDVFKGKIQYIFNDGICKFQKESTIIDLTNEEPQILRVGVISQEEIEAVLNMKIK